MGHRTLELKIFCLVECGGGSESATLRVVEANQLRQPEVTSE